jgi:hypothetical protein
MGGDVVVADEGMYTMLFHDVPEHDKHCTRAATRIANTQLRIVAVRQLHSHDVKYSPIYYSRLDARQRSTTVKGAIRPSRPKPRDL